MKMTSVLALGAAAIALSLPACDKPKEAEHIAHTIVLTTPVAQNVVIAQQYVCQIRSRRHIDVQAMQNGYLEEITVQEGQAVKKGEVLFKVIPTFYQAKLAAEIAEVRLAEIEYLNTQRLHERKVVSEQEVLLFEAKLARAEARRKLAEADLYFSSVRAPFDGIIDRQQRQQGSEVKEGDILTTLSDNEVMWVYFNVPEARYLEFRDREGSNHNVSQLRLVDSRLELILANGRKFDQSAGNTVTVEGKVDFETGNYKFRADFPNPDRLLRQGQTGTVRILQTLHDAIVIPQRATFEILDKQYVLVVGDDGVARQRQITIAHEMEDKFVIESGLTVQDRIVLEGVQQLHNGDTVEEYEFEKPDAALAHQKFPAE